MPGLNAPAFRSPDSADLRPVDWSASCGFAFELGPDWVSRFSISRNSSNSSKSLYKKVLGAIWGPIALGSFLLERSAGAQCPGTPQPDSVGFAVR